MPTEKVAKKYGVTGNSVKKWCKKLDVQKPPRGYWQKNKEYQKTRLNKGFECDGST